MVKYISPDAAMDMPDLVGMRVTTVNGADVKKYPLEKARGSLSPHLHSPPHTASLTAAAPPCGSCWI